MRNIKILIEYDGTNYSGWQIQENAITIQEKIEEAIEKAFGYKVRIIGAGRTDGRVHAKGQVANFLTNTHIKGDKLKHLINRYLPEDILILESQDVEPSFHSRFDAKGKKYKYIVYNNPIGSPLYRNYSYHVSYDLNFKEMEKAAKYFVGTHDFRAFMSSKAVVPHTVRTINSLELIKKDDFIEFTIDGNAFLHNMIRIIVGTLIFVGRNRIKSEDVPQIIKSQNRKTSGPTVPPQGLFLEKIYY